MRRKNVGTIAAVFLGLIFIFFLLRYIIPFLTAKDEASRAPVAQQICPSFQALGNQNAQCFQILADESEVRFTIDEELGGVPNLVVGRTNQLAGEILIDLETPSNSQIGPIEINLRTLATDRAGRDRMIRAEILKSGQDAYEFTHFTPTAISALPASITIGEPFIFNVTGDFSLLDTTQSLTFSVTATALSQDRLQGYGVATVLRSDYGLEIPTVENVANVGDEVILEIDFIAIKLDSPSQLAAEPD